MPFWKWRRWSSLPLEKYRWLGFLRTAISKLRYLAFVRVWENPTKEEGRRWRIWKMFAEDFITALRWLLSWLKRAVQTDKCPWSSVLVFPGYFAWETQEKFLGIPGHFPWKLQMTRVPPQVQILRGLKRFLLAWGLVIVGVRDTDSIVSSYLYSYNILASTAYHQLVCPYNIKRHTHLSLKFR